MTFETFQKICMRSKADKANDVRDYFITLQKFIDNYKYEIDDKLENDFFKQYYGYIYIILVNSTKDIRKIGIVNSGTVKQRLRNYMTGKDKHPDVEFILKIDEPRKIERCIGKIIKDNKLKGKENQEIYKISFKSAREAILQCGCYSGIIDKIENKVNCYIVLS